jgi:hypothetical protein
VSSYVDNGFDMQPAPDASLTLLGRATEEAPSAIKAVERA